jgi:hypothetical protein
VESGGDILGQEIKSSVIGRKGGVQHNNMTSGPHAPSLFHIYNIIKYTHFLFNALRIVSYHRILLGLSIKLVICNIHSYFFVISLTPASSALLPFFPKSGQRFFWSTLNPDCYHPQKNTLLSTRITNCE